MAAVLDRLTWVAVGHRLVAALSPGLIVSAWGDACAGDWNCSTLFDAYEGHEWRFSVTLPGEDRPRSGQTLPDSLALLADLRARPRDSSDGRDRIAFVEAAVAVVRWGQVRRNEARLRARGERALPVLSEAAGLLDPSTARLSALGGVSDMNSGFSKIYPLMLDDFPIYDSQVACALGSLVRAHCVETGLSTVPEVLAFGVPASRGSVSRDPRPARCGSRRSGRPSDRATRGRT